MEESGNLMLLTQMISDLSRKVDSMIERQVTRDEFGALARRLDDFVVRREFELYREQMDKLDREKFSNMENEIKALRDRVGGFGKLPPWAQSLILVGMGILNLGTMVATFGLHFWK